MGSNLGILGHGLFNFKPIEMTVTLMHTLVSWSLKMYCLLLQGNNQFTLNRVPESFFKDKDTLFSLAMGTTHLHPNVRYSVWNPLIALFLLCISRLKFKSCNSQDL